MPPDCSAGKNFTRPKPWASACISSDAVAIPGANGKALAAAACSNSGVAPGLMPKLGADILRARQIIGIQDGADPDHGLGHIGDDGLRGRKRHQRAQGHFQHAHAAGDQRSRQRNRVREPLDGQDRDDAAGFKQRREFFLFRSSS